MEKSKIHIFDTTLRDGEQVPGCKLNTNQKIEIAEQLDYLGVDIIEAGFPISSPGDFNSVIEISKIVKNAAVCALTRANKKDIEVAAQSIEHAKKPRIHTGIGVSDLHIFTKLKKTKEEIIDLACEAVRYSKTFVDDVEFYAEDAGRCDNAFLAHILEKVIEAGATVLNIPDTTGYCLPNVYGKKIQYLKNNVKGVDNVILSTHCHNDLGLATANSIEGIKHGARQVECTINGIGERAGNTALEEVVMIIKLHANMGFYTDIKKPMLCSLSKLVSNHMGFHVQPNKSIVGSNAFAHSSGIHQDGVIKNRLNYEIINPEDVGAESSKIDLTARSGKAALKFRLKALNISIENINIEEIYQSFLFLADEKKQIDDQDLLELVKQ